jgi:hypothetical protein
MNKKLIYLAFIFCFYSIAVYPKYFNSNIDNNWSMQKKESLFTSERDIDNKLKKSSLLYSSLNIGINVTSNRMELFEYDDGTKIGISRNGVVGIGAIVGYTTSLNFDFSLGFYLYHSELTGQPENASAIFNKFYFNPVIKYVIENKSNKLALNYGVGLLLTNQPWLDIDGSEVPGGAHNKFQFNNAIGATFHLELQNGSSAQNENVIWKVYVKYNLLTYKLKTAMLDDINWPLDILPDEIKSEVMELNSDGFEIGFAIGIPIYRHEHK